MVMANETAVKLDLMSKYDALRIKTLLQKYSLPTTYLVKNPATFYETFYLDKKSADSKITFIIPVGLGGVEITDSIDSKIIMEVLSEFGDAK